MKEKQTMFMSYVSGKKVRHHETVKQAERRIINCLEKIKGSGKVKRHRCGKDVDFDNYFFLIDKEGTEIAYGRIYVTAQTNS